MSKIIYDEATMTDMINEFNKAAKELRAVIKQMQGIGRVVENGALIGKGGTDLKAAVNNTLCSSIERLASEMEAKARLVQKELEQHKRAAKTSRD